MISFLRRNNLCDKNVRSSAYTTFVVNQRGPSREIGAAVVFVEMDCTSSRRAEQVMGRTLVQASHQQQNIHITSRQQRVRKSHMQQHRKLPMTKSNYIPVKQNLSCHMLLLELQAVPPTMGSATLFQSRSNEACPMQF